MSLKKDSPTSRMNDFNLEANKKEGYAYFRAKGLSREKAKQIYISSQELSIRSIRSIPPFIRAAYGEGHYDGANQTYKTDHVLLDYYHPKMRPTLPENWEALEDFHTTQPKASDPNDTFTFYTMHAMPIAGSEDQKVLEQLDKETSQLYAGEDLKYQFNCTTLAPEQQIMCMHDLQDYYLRVPTDASGNALFTPPDAEAISFDEMYEIEQESNRRGEKCIGIAAIKHGNP